MCIVCIHTYIHIRIYIYIKYMHICMFFIIYVYVFPLLDGKAPRSPGTEKLSFFRGKKVLPVPTWRDGIWAGKTCCFIRKNRISMDFIIQTVESKQQKVIGSSKLIKRNDAMLRYEFLTICLYIIKYRIVVFGSWGNPVTQCRNLTGTWPRILLPTGC